MKVEGLRRAYATLGLADNATPGQIRDAYLTWVELLEGAVAPAATDAERAATDLSRHELDLAWHAIEQAHTRAARVPQQVRRCQECTSTPAVRVVLHRVEPDGALPRVRTTDALLCRDCGLRACRRTQRQMLRRGWSAVRAPFANLRALGGNSMERAVLRRIPPASARPLPFGGRMLGRPSEPGRTSRGLTRCGMIWLAIVTAFLLAIGLATPSDPANADPTHGGQTRSTAPA